MMEVFHLTVETTINMEILKDDTLRTNMNLHIYDNDTGVEVLDDNYVLMIRLHGLQTHPSLALSNQTSMDTRWSSRARQMRSARGLTGG